MENCLGSIIQRRRAIAVLLIFLASGCVEPYFPPVIITNHNYLVVEGFLVGNDSTFVKLSRTQVIGDPGTVKGESHALVEIEGDNGEHYSLSEKQNGLYFAPPLNIGTNVKYRLRIRTDDRYEYLSDYVAGKRSPSLDSITWEQDISNDAVQFNLYAHDSENETRYYMWTYDETWQYSASRSLYYFENGQILPRDNASEFYHCWKTNVGVNFYLHATTSLAEDVVHDFKLFSIPQWERKMNIGYSILVREYALTKEAFDYWALTKKNSENLGSLFDPMPSQALSNIRCISNTDEVVIGHFSVSTVQKKRTTIHRHQVSGPWSRPFGPTGYEACEGEIVPLDEMTEKRLQGRLIGDRVYDLITQELIGYAVGLIECMDCRVKGGVTTMPDYWK